MSISGENAWFRYVGECGTCAHRVNAVAPTKVEMLWVRCGECGSLTATPYKDSKT